MVIMISAGNGNANFFSVNSFGSSIWSCNRV